MSILTHPLQHISGRDHDRHLMMKALSELEAEQSPISTFLSHQVAQLVEHLNKASTSFSMEISVEKTMLMTNNSSGINTKIKVNGQKLETVTSFKHLGSVITD